jgi:D,D-heptose 1,7-bisphosphate phosphatase
MTNKAVFLDRDDTLIIDSGYISTPGQVKLVQGASESLVELRTMRYKLVVVSNQSGVARGILTEKTLNQIHDRMRELLARRGAVIDAIYCCPYHPDGVIEKYRRESEMRKPNPGMLLAAAADMDIDLKASWLIGDSTRDIEAGRRAGCRTILVRRPGILPSAAPERPEADFLAVNLREAVNIIKKHNQQRPGPDRPSTPAAAAPPEAAVHGPPEPPSAAETPAAAPPAEPPTAAEPAEPPALSGTEELLSSILAELRRFRRDEMFTDFSIMRLLAGLLQIMVLLCVVISLWYLTDPARSSGSVQTALGFAAVLQLMSLTFYLAQRR